MKTLSRDAALDAATSLTPKVAVIGAGQWGRNLVSTFAKLGALAAVAEPRAEVRAELAASYPETAMLASAAEALEGPWPAVAIATPAPEHFRVARAALLAGKHVFVEKPLTLAAEEARELVALGRRQGRHVMVGHLLLYQPAVRWLKAFLGAGELGRLHSLHQERLNMGRVRAAENVLWSFGVHDLAVLLHLVGQSPDTLSAWGQRVLQPHIEDDVHLHLGFADATQAHLHVSWLWPEKRRRLTIVGSKGMLTYDELEQAVYFHRKGVAPDLSVRDGGAEKVFEGHAEPLTLELSHFLACIEGREQPLSDGASGLAVVEILEQASRQLEEHHANYLRPCHRDRR